MKPPFSPGNGKREIYQEQYEASKQGGEMFFPDTMVRDAIVALVIVAAIIALAVIFPATSEGPADPTTTTYNPRPEWYFLFFFEFLKLFPGWLEPVAAVVVPLLALTILAIVPFLDSSLERRWAYRKKMLTIGVLALMVLIALGVGGTLSAPARPAGEATQQVAVGRSVYNQINCGYCHSINGVGGTIGPDLTNIGGELSPQAIAGYLQNPHAMIPKSLHPKLEFTQEEMQALISYLETLGAKVSYTAQAPGLFQKNCGACHVVNGQGGALGPHLSTVGSRRPMSFIEAFTTDPKSVIPGATMPAFRDALTPDEIKDIAAYLSSLKAQTPATATPK